MGNFSPTNEIGTTRRRAKSIIINNPAMPSNPKPGEVVPLASVTFVMEDRILMADGNDIFIPKGNMTIPINAALLAKAFPSIDTDTGVINEQNTRHGYELLTMITKALEDIFITIGVERTESGEIK